MGLSTSYATVYKSLQWASTKIDAEFHSKYVMLLKFVQESLRHCHFFQAIITAPISDMSFKRWVFTPS